MTKDFKSLVQEIQKMAKMPPKPSDDWQRPSSVPKPGVVPQGGAPVRMAPQGDPNIKKMQEAILQLSKDVASQMKGSGGGDQRSQQEASGRDSFGDFLARTFMRNSNVNAIEFSPDPNKTKMQDKDPTQANKMSWVMDTMDRLGHAVSETFADGIWGPRTQAALVNVIAFTNGLFNVAKAFNVQAKSYNEGYLHQLQPIAETTAEELTTEDKRQDATVITKHIYLIRRMYEEIKEQVLNLPRYQTYIEADTPYLSHDKPSFQLTPQQLASIKQSFPEGFTIPINEQASAKIGVDNLTSVEALDKWIKQFPKDNLDPNKILTMVTDQITQGKGA